MIELGQHLLDGLALGSIYALIALGYTLVYGILRLINFAHADVFMVGAYVVMYIGRALGANEAPSPLTAFLVFAGSMVASAALGLVIERFAYRPLRKAPRVNALITAIGVSLLLQNLALLVFGARPQSFPEILPRVELAAGPLLLSSYQLIVIVTAALLMLALHAFVTRTRVGRAMRAVSFSFETASLMGIDVDRIVAVTFAIGSALAAAGGILYGLLYRSLEPTMGVQPGLKAFVAAVIGGIGHLPGAMAGGVLMGLVETLVVAYTIADLKDALAFALLIVILVARPSGLFGHVRPEKV